MQPPFGGQGRGGGFPGIPGGASLPFGGPGGAQFLDPRSMGLPFGGPVPGGMGGPGGSLLGMQGLHGLPHQPSPFLPNGGQPMPSPFQNMPGSFPGGMGGPPHDHGGRPQPGMYLDQGSSIPGMGGGGRGGGGGYGGGGGGGGFGGCGKGAPRGDRDNKGSKGGGRGMGGGNDRKGKGKDGGGMGKGGKGGSRDGPGGKSGGAARPPPPPPAGANGAPAIAAAPKPKGEGKGKKGKGKGKMKDFEAFMEEMKGKGWGKGFMGMKGKMFGDSSMKVWIGNIAEETTWKDLQAHLNQAGRSMWVEVFSGKGKGTGACVFNSIEDADKAVAELNGSELQGSAIVVDHWSKPAQPEEGEAKTDGDAANGEKLSV